MDDIFPHIQRFQKFKQKNYQSTTVWKLLNIRIQFFFNSWNSPKVIVELCNLMQLASHQ